MINLFKKVGKMLENYNKFNFKPKLLRKYINASFIKKGKN